MAKSKQTSNKREKEKNKLKKRKEKEQRKEDRKKLSANGTGFDPMLSLVIEAEQLSLKRPTPAAQQQESEVKIGKVVYLNAPKHYGFIRDARVKENLFFDIDGLPWEVTINDLVTFTRTKSTRGSTATSIEKIVETT